MSMKKTRRIFSLAAAIMLFSSVCFSTGLTTKVNAVDNSGDDWLHCKGNRIYDMNGKEVLLTGANWFGFNCSENVFHGAWYDVKNILKGVADRGIGFLRVPVSTELLYSWMSGKPNKVSSVTAANDAPYMVCNPDFVDPETGKVADSLYIFDKILGFCKEYGIKVMIDVHSPDANNSGHMYELWYGKETSTAGVVTTDMWIDTLAWMADRYKNDDTILAYDLKNEPHGKRGYTAETPTNIAKWDNSTDENNWKYASEKCAKAILGKNPNVLIMIEGIEQYPKTEKGYTFDTPDVWGATGDAAPWYGAWWGGNLRGVKDYPVNLGSLNSQIVYSPHDYGPSVYNQSWFDKDFTEQTLLDDYWYDSWAYINDKGIAPLLIGEWGGFMDGGKNQKWMELLRDYMIKNHINHTFWCLNPNSGDTGGLLGNDWSTWDEQKYGLLKPALWHTGDKFIGLDHQIPLGSKGITVTEYYGIKVPTPTPPGVTPTPVKVTPTPTSPVGTLKGDVNGDGKVNSTDASILKRIILDTYTGSYNKDNADMNGDGKINSTDVSLLKRNILGIS